ncbi:MAG TPA: hypothetical protein VHP37_15840 [Burkholderiales bacterium]|nr:hypothetical protein [Burkholderiales bacterium]
MSLALAMGLTACDPSQKKPEVIETAVLTQRVGDTPATVPEATGSPSAGSERSVRLFGPGISRQRQTRI